MKKVNFGKGWILGVLAILAMVVFLIIKAVQDFS